MRGNSANGDGEKEERSKEWEETQVETTRAVQEPDMPGPSRRIRCVAPLRTQAAALTSAKSSSASWTLYFPLGTRVSFWALVLLCGCPKAQSH